MNDVIGILNIYFVGSSDNNNNVNLVQARAVKPSKQVNLINLELKLDNKDLDTSKLQLLSVLAQNPTFLGRVG